MGLLGGSVGEASVFGSDDLEVLGSSAHLEPASPFTPPAACVLLLSVSLSQKLRLQKKKKKKVRSSSVKWRC